MNGSARRKSHLRMSKFDASIRRRRRPFFWIGMQSSCRYEERSLVIGEVEMNLRKDHSLDALAESGNVAQFVSFEPTGATAGQTHSRLWRYSPNHRFSSAAEALRALLANSPDGSINLR